MVLDEPICQAETENGLVGQGEGESGGMERAGGGGERAGEGEEQHCHIHCGDRTPGWREAALDRGSAGPGRP